MTTRADIGVVRRTNIGFLLAKASQRWNELLAEAFRASGHGDVRPSYGSVLVPLFEEDGLRMGELAARSHVAKQTMTTMVRVVEGAGFVERRPDLEDAARRASTSRVEDTGSDRSLLARSPGSNGASRIASAIVALRRCVPSSPRS